ncbi:MAG: radical SAM family heme chaperone HemW [Eubacteriales bacterium]
MNLSAEKSHKKKTGLYLHIPFCARKCAYCDFYSLTDLSLADRYLNALCTHTVLLGDIMRDRIFDTVYIGGGTPSLMGAKRMDALLDCLFSCFSITADAEITAEVNPATVDAEELRIFHEIGINRLSIGLQSANGRELSDLSRLHDYDGFLATYREARNAGFDNLSVDLMYGIPEQTLSSLLETLKKVCDLSPEHLSLYGLKVEPNTPFGRMGKNLILPDEDAQCEMYEGAVGYLSDRGYRRYEISNFAKKGCESKHNLRYWHGEEYLGLGPAAHSYLNGVRYAYPRDLMGYMETLEQGRLPAETDRQIITQAERENEKIMLGLRLEEGIPAETRLCQRAKRYIEAGFMKVTDGRLSFTTKGFLVSNPILADLIDE